MVSVGGKGWTLVTMEALDVNEDRVSQCDRDLPSGWRPWVVSEPCNTNALPLASAPDPQCPSGFTGTGPQLPFTGMGRQGSATATPRPVGTSILSQGVTLEEFLLWEARVMSAGPFTVYPAPVS